MTVIAEITYTVAAGVTMIVVVQVTVTALNFILKRCRDQGVEVESVRIVTGNEN